MTPEALRYSFKTADDTKWYYVDASGNVQTSLYPKYFRDDTDRQYVSPVDWKDTQIGYARNEKYKAVFTKFSVPIKFTFDAVVILKKIYAIEGYEGTCIFVIDRRNDNWVYEKLITCEVDLSQVQGISNVKDRSVSVACAEQGLPEDLKVKEDLPCEIPFDGDALTVQHDGMILQLQYTWVTQNVEYGVRANERLYIDIAYAGLETNPYFQSFIFPQTQGSHTDIKDINKKLFVTNLYIDAEIYFEFDIEIEALNTVQAGLQIQVHLDDVPYPPPSGAFTATNHVLYQSNTGFIPANQKRRVKTSGTLKTPLLAGRMNKLRVSGNNGVADTSQQIIVKIYNFKLIIKGTARLPGSDIKAYPYLTFLNKLFKKQLGAGVNVVSNYLNTDQNLQNNFDTGVKMVTVTSGDAIRQSEEPKIKTSITEAFKDMQRWGLGLAVEGNNVRIERAPYFFQKDRIIGRLTEVSNFKFSNANDYLGNNIKTGYPDQKYDELNGKDDYFGITQYEFPSKRVKSVIEWSSPYFASPLAIEYIRTLFYLQKTTTDSQFDNQTYLIEVNTVPVDGKYQLLRRQNIPGNSLTGLLQPNTWFNLGLSPATAIRHNAELILGMSFGAILNNGRPIKWLTNDKNNKVTRDLDSYLIKESGDVIPNQLQVLPDGVTTVTPLFKPTIFEFDTAVPPEIFTKLDNNFEDRYGAIEFIHPDSGVIMKMFILDIALKPGTNENYVVRGLCTPDTDLNGL